jgi:hypothetical protein
VIFFIGDAQCIDKASKWAIHTVRPLQSFVGSRVVLIGDAVSPKKKNLVSSLPFDMIFFL